MKHWLKKSVLLFGAMSLNPINAQGADVPFSGNISNGCIITLTQAGILDPRPNLRRITSRSGPGSPGRATVNTPGTGFTLSVEAPSSFDNEPAADAGSPETFRAWHRSNGATTYGNTRNPEALNPGISNIRVHMDARKPRGSTFAGGDYAATVILRCE